MTSRWFKSFGEPVKASMEFFKNPSMDTFGGALLGGESMNHEQFGAIADKTPWNDESFFNKFKDSTVGSRDFRQGAGTIGGLLGAYFGGSALMGSGSGGAGSAGGAETSPWVMGEGGMYTLPGEGGSSSFGGISEPPAGTNWWNMASKGMKLGNLLGGGTQGQQQGGSSPYGSINSTTAWINRLNEEQRRSLLAQNLRNQKRMEGEDMGAFYG